MWVAAPCPANQPANLEHRGPWQLAMPLKYHTNFDNENDKIQFIMIDKTGIKLVIFTIPTIMIT
jgi:hypothetical protein